jgi:hypothetical protein
MHVKVSKTAGQNDGPVKMFLASILGVIPADVSGTAVAIISFPKVVGGRDEGGGPGGLKPMVATKAIVDKYLNLPGNFQFKIGEESKDPSINDTMWSTFKVDSDSNAYTKELILTGNPEPFAIGDSVYLQPGARAVDYGPEEMGKFINQTVVLMTVDPSTMVEKTMAPILGFVAFHITGYSQGGKYVEGYFDKEYLITNPQKPRLPDPDNPPSSSNSPQLVY